MKLKNSLLARTLPILFVISAPLIMGQQDCSGAFTTSIAGTWSEEGEGWTFIFGNDGSFTARLSGETAGTYQFEPIGGILTIVIGEDVEEYFLAIVGDTMFLTPSELDSGLRQYTLILVE